MTHQDPEPLVMLTTCGDNAEAAGIRALLEADGIRCVIQGEPLDHSRRNRRRAIGWSILLFLTAPLWVGLFAALLRRR